MSDDPKCPVCSGKMWDNRDTKRNPKAPDFKCRDKSCEGVIWPPKDGPLPYSSKASAATIKANPVKQPYSVGGPIPGVDDEHPALPHERLDKLFALYDLCFSHAFSLAERTMKQDASHEGISAMAATVFIAAKDRGLGV